MWTIILNHTHKQKQNKSETLKKWCRASLCAVTYLWLCSLDGLWEGEERQGQICKTILVALKFGMTLSQLKMKCLSGLFSSVTLLHKHKSQTNWPINLYHVSWGVLNHKIQASSSLAKNLNKNFHVCSAENSTRRNVNKPKCTLKHT